MIRPEILIHTEAGCRQKRPDAEVDGGDAGIETVDSTLSTNSQPFERRATHLSTLARDKDAITNYRRAIELGPPFGPARIALSMELL